MKKNSFSKFIDHEKKELILLVSKSFFWFLVGIFLGLFFLISFVFLIFQKMYSDVVYPGVMVNNILLEGKTQDQVKKFFVEKNKNISNTKFIFINQEDIATISAKELEFSYNEDLLAKQAYSIGRSNSPLSNISLLFQAYVTGINLAPSYHYSEDKLQKILLPMTEKINTPAIDALFNFENRKVIAFKPSSDGQEVDMKELENKLNSKLVEVISSKKPLTINIVIPIKILKPKITTDKANNLGVEELISQGTSLFYHSIPNRIYNITLASERLNGILVAPQEIFSFNQALGDVSAFTGYQQAYVIQNGKTVLGDGGGVCQVSTTLFRAVLNAGLPVIERRAHAYRVGYYEQDSDPGLDATVYSPSPDLKFKNDTPNYILIQTNVDGESQRLTFMLYGKKDGREVILNKPVIVSQTPPPPAVYQDDPTLLKGVTKQVDFQAWGASVYFTRKVIKNGKTIISDKFVSNYQPWAAVYLRGTKE
ncbi:MAG: VanW family protein [Candidatus Levyibacteriota bacterium]